MLSVVKPQTKVYNISVGPVLLLRATHFSPSTPGGMLSPRKGDSRLGGGAEAPTLRGRVSQMHNRLDMEGLGKQIHQLNPVDAVPRSERREVPRERRRIARHQRDRLRPQLQ